jgi:hypothetical protein
MEEESFSGVLSPNEVVHIYIYGVFNMRDININLSKLDVGIDVDWHITKNGEKTQTNKNISAISSIESADELNIFLKNTSEEPKNYAFDIKYVDKPQKTAKNTKVKKFTSYDEFSSIASDIEQDLNIFVNKNDGLLVEYYRVTPTKDDVIFKENTHKKFFEMGCINIITEDNQLPQLDEAVVTEWGSEFDTFSAEISSGYFESIFGECERPEENDYLVIKKINRAFEVKSVVLKRDSEGLPLTYSLKIGEFEDRDSVEKPENFEESLRKSEDMFNDQIEKEIEDVVSMKETTPSFIFDDIQKTYVSEDVVMGDGHYDMGAGAGVGVKYKPNNHFVKNISLCFRPYGGSKILSLGSDDIFVNENGKLVFCDVEIGDVEIGEKNHFSVNIYETHIEVSSLNSNMSEKTNTEIVGSFTKTATDISLHHGNYEIFVLAICKKHIARTKANIVFSKSRLKNSGDFSIYDTFDPTLNMSNSNMGSYLRE